jgi:hypothetical protein
MKSVRRGRHISDVEVTNILQHGLWLLIGTRELFVPFEHFPWFKEASVGQVLNVTLPHRHHLYWPDLDVDLAVDSIEHPDRYPLVSRVRPNSGAQPSKAAARSTGKKKKRESDGRRR